MNKSNRRNDNRNDKPQPFSNFLNTVDRLFSEKPTKGFLQSLDDFFLSVGERSFPVELHDKDSYYLVTASIPGVSKDQLDIEILPQSITISIQQTQIDELTNDQQKAYSRKHFSQRLTKNISFPSPINQDKVTASHRDGVLKLKIPKVKGNKIHIEG